MKLPIFIADAFTARAFCGNPAAVCLLENELENDTYQNIAKEMNLSETAFVRKLSPTDNFTQSSCFGLRWFTPASEVPLFFCFLAQTAIGDTLVQDIQYSPDTRKLLVRLSDSYKRSFLETLKVNTENLPHIENTGKVKGLILTLKGEPGGQTQAFDFYSRYFAPWWDVAEDPVTGSAHTILSSYWSQQLGKKQMRAFQCSRRGGELNIALRPDGRVDVKGAATVVLEGTLMV
ncbi:PREDICTED: phenazine biosynthesis-like domain-containing protein [Dipodomys ordii]|uniref:Phenazine biosynthesis-like domain-containing protein n=1 Tax=Dipodomys ordii TaxID=10020 RepID=A0A1S3F7F1_DIPOR|nr:PREDICTED: phenazine biosynthesis-like domain-containing protein [Dipodomys ordii]